MKAITAMLLLLLFQPLTSASPIRATCTDGGSILLQTNLRGVFFQVINDVWGDPGNRHEQCVFAGDGGLGWRWLKPSFSYQPYFPNLLLNVNQYFHVTTAQLHKLQVVFSAVVRGTGTYNLAFDVWFSADRDGKQLTDEVMVWMLWTNRTIRLSPVVNDGFNDYGYITFKASWRFHAFLLLANRIPFLVDLGKLIHSAQVSGYLKSISLGNELFSGIGQTNIYAINMLINDLSIRNAGACYSLPCAGNATTSSIDAVSLGAAYPVPALANFERARKDLKTQLAT